MNLLYNRISARDYVERQDDILALSGMSEDIRDALLDYQVGFNKPRTVITPLNLGCFDRCPSNGQCTTRVAV